MSKPLNNARDELLELADEFDGYRLDLDDGISKWSNRNFTIKECELIASALRAAAAPPHRSDTE